MNDFQFYFKLGLQHILSLDATDHILFLWVLILVFSLSDWKSLLKLVTLFTIAHTSSLFLSVYGYISIANSLIENTILLTIIITALSNILIHNEKYLHKTHYYFSFFFGLIHGLGFASDFKMMIAGQQQAFVKLIYFAFGIEVAQILLGLTLLILISFMLKAFSLKKKDIVWLLSSAIIGYTIALL